MFAFIIKAKFLSKIKNKTKKKKMLRTVTLSWIAKNNVSGPLVRITGFTTKPLHFGQLGILDCETLFLDNSSNIVGNASGFFFPRLQTIYVPCRQAKKKMELVHKNIILLPADEYINRIDRFEHYSILE
jgi:hypothetical protein